MALVGVAPLVGFSWLIVSLLVVLSVMIIMALCFVISSAVLRRLESREVLRPSVVDRQVHCCEFFNFLTLVFVVASDLLREWWKQMTSLPSR